MLLDAKVDDAEMANYATTATTHTRTIIDGKFTNTNGGPDALNRLSESDALGAYANFSTMVANLTGAKANAADVTASY